jgi:hypothetical protein
MSEFGSGGYAPELERPPEPEKQERLVANVKQAEITMPGVEDMPRTGDTYIVSDRTNDSRYNTTVLTPLKNGLRPPGSFYVSGFRDSKGNKIELEQALALYDKQDKMPEMEIIALPIVDPTNDKRKEQYIARFKADESTEGELL